MNYVVGFIGNDWTVGRTFFCRDDNEIQDAFKRLMEDNKETESEIIHNGTDGIRTKLGFYFCGGLE